MKGSGSHLRFGVFRFFNDENEVSLKWHDKHDAIFFFPFILRWIWHYKVKNNFKERKQKMNE